jgi:hypothetical protein
MKMYRCKATIEVHLAVESPSLAEAESKIDGILRHAGEVLIFEGSSLNPIDELTGSRPQARRIGRLQAEL